MLAEGRISSAALVSLLPARLVAGIQAARRTFPGCTTRGDETQQCVPG